MTTVYRLGRPVGSTSFRCWLCSKLVAGCKVTSKPLDQPVDRIHWLESSVTLFSPAHKRVTLVGLATVSVQYFAVIPLFWPTLGNSDRWHAIHSSRKRFLCYSYTLTTAIGACEVRF